MVPNCHSRSFMDCHGMCVGVCVCVAHQDVFEMRFAKMPDEQIGRAHV